MSLSVDETKNLSKLFRNLGDALLSYKTLNWKILSQEQKNVVADIQTNLYNLSDEMVNNGLSSLGAQAQASIVALRNSTTNLTDAITRIKNCNQGIILATDVIGLATAILEGNVAQILTEIQTIASSG